MTVDRLPAPFGEKILRDKSVRFTFDGRPFFGYEGDTLASALWANDQRGISRSFKYHRARGMMSHAGQEANTWVEANGIPNCAAERLNIKEGDEFRSQNHLGSQAVDLLAVVGLFSRFLPVGFYYRGFFRPAGIWEHWAKLFRHMTGLGVIAGRPERSSLYDKQYLFCDIAVVGAGPAGLAAAEHAASTGYQVCLIEQSAGPPLADPLRPLWDTLAAMANVSVLSEACCTGWFADHLLAVVQSSRLIKLRAKKTIFACGALDQPAVFRNNDLPGIILSSAAEQLLKHYAVRPGNNAIVLLSEESGYRTAAMLLDAGVAVTAVVDLRSQSECGRAERSLSQQGIPILRSSMVYEAHSTLVGSALHSVSVKALNNYGECSGPRTTLRCDTLCVSVGSVPAFLLPCQAGAKLSYDETKSRFRLQGNPTGVMLAGAVNGVSAPELAAKDGRVAASRAIHELSNLHAELSADWEEETLHNVPWAIAPHPKGKEFVDLDEDLHLADIINACRDGYDHIQLVKRYSTLGMGPSQGRHSALNAARIVAKHKQTSLSNTGVTTARPPCGDETLAHSAGRSFFPERFSPLHHRHIEAGATMMVAGNWYRPAYYPRATMASELGREPSSNLAVANTELAKLRAQSEAKHVRRAVGIIDVSTLGGIDLMGPDACDFLEQMVGGRFASLACGSSRYALTCNEAGVVIDDGVIARISQDHFYVTATTSGVDRVFRHMLQMKALWSLDVEIVNVTSAYAAINVAGPKARALLAATGCSQELNAHSFPYLGVQLGTVAGVSARIMRVGFVGELGYELHLPWMQAEAVWDALLDAGQALDVKPFGVEAQRLLRLEKGHVIVGQDSDAMTTPYELQMHWAVAQSKPYFIGGRTLQEHRELGEQRILIGFECEDSAAGIPAENQLIVRGEKMIGRVTSCAWSPTLRKIIGLAYVPPVLQEPGSEFTIKLDARNMLSARTTSTPFYDPKGERQSL